MDAETIKRSFDGSGLRGTSQRYAVMAFLMEHNRHPTAAEISEAVNRVDPRSSRATTYNNLRDLVKAGLVREVAVEGRAARFEIGRASCRERVEISVGAVSLKKNKNILETWYE